jgi:hypothetical protein
MTMYQGSCHCGAVRFEVDLDLAKGVNKCNCSYCTKARSWFAIVKPDQLHMLAGVDGLTAYRWVPPGKPAAYLHHDFCKTCGVRTVGGGGADGKTDFNYVCIAALDGVDHDALVAAPLKIADGRHDQFDKKIADPGVL